VIFDKRLGALQDQMTPQTEKFIRAVGESVEALHTTVMYWPLHKHKNTKAWKKLVVAADVIWE
jgi:hypothetical protein